MSAVPYHHYVPRFYLKGFTDPELLQRTPPQKALWAYRRNHRPWRRAITRVGGEEGFYRHEGGDFEQRLACREREWARLLAKLLKDRVLHGSERGEFSRFIGVMSTRGRYFFDMTQAVARYVADYIVERGLDEMAAQRLRERLTASNVLPPQVTKKWTLTEMLDTGNDYIPLLYEKMRWIVVQAREDDHVVTSDTPVSLTDSNGPIFTSTGMRFSAGAEFTLPLDREHVLLGTGQKNEGMASGTGFAIRQFNRRTIKMAYKAVYAPVNSSALEKLVNEQVGTKRLPSSKEEVFAQIDEVLRKWGYDW